LNYEHIFPVGELHGHLWYSRTMNSSPSLGNPNILQEIIKQLDSTGAKYQIIEHSPARTSEESAAARGEDLSVGAKALLLKVGEAFEIYVLPADRKLDSTAIRNYRNVKNSRFATIEELFEKTGLVPGCVPPFGAPILSFPIYADNSVGTSHGRVAFNAGMLTVSIIISTSDWECIAKPERFSFAQ